MKILQIVADGNPGGGTTFVLEMLKSLEHPIFLSQKDSHAIEQAQSLEIETNELDFFTSRLDFGIARNMQKLIKHIQPDIIHVHGNRAAFFLSFCRCPYPVVYTIHGLHGLYNGNLLGKWGEKKAMRCADRIVFVSKAEEQLALKKNLLPHSNHQVINNGIVMENLPRRKPSTSKLLGFLGRLETPKDPLFMLDVMDILGPQGYHLKMIGGGTFEKEMQRSPYITVTGKLSRENALEELADVSAVVAPSKWEAFGLVLIESMALGIPIIASRIPAFEELMVSGQTGVLIDEKDPKKYANAVLEQADYSQAAQEHALENFSWEHCFQQYQSIFTDLV